MSLRLQQFEILEGEIILDILEHSQYCHIATVDDEGMPYILTMFYGYWKEDQRIYIHGAKEGRKAEIFSKEATHACVQVLDHVQMVPDESPCDYFCGYRSVVIDALVRPTCCEEEHLRALDLITKKYAGIENYNFSKEMLEQTATWCIEFLRITGKEMPSEM